MAAERLQQCLVYQILATLSLQLGIMATLMYLYNPHLLTGSLLQEQSWSIGQEREVSEIIVGNIINTYKSCPKCGTTDHLYVKNHDMMWHDGEVWCRKCNVYVREYDAG